VKLKIYGGRGTIPFFSKNTLTYGGNTACVRVETEGRTILLDAGTGLGQFAEEMKDVRPLECDILISHLHFDHIIGLLNFGRLFDSANKIRIFTKSRSLLPIGMQVFAPFKPPYWPIELAKLNKAEVLEIKDEIPFFLNEKIKITSFNAQHPNSTSSFRIDADKSIVYLVDYEIDENKRYDELLDFCENADLIILDTSYFPDDYPPKRGWGHSTYEMGMALAERCACKKMMFFHFSQDYTDETLNSLANTLSDRFLIAREGLEIEI